MSESIHKSTFKWPKQAMFKQIIRPQPPPSKYLLSRKYPPECHHDCAFHGNDVLLYQKLKNKEANYKTKPLNPKRESVYQRDYQCFKGKTSNKVHGDEKKHWTLLKTYRDEFSFDIVAHPLPRIGNPIPVTFVPVFCTSPQWPGPSEYQSTISRNGSYYVTTMQQHRYPKPVKVFHSENCKCI